MIMSKNKNSTYNQVGFISDGKSFIDRIYDKNGDLYFEQGYTNTVSGIPPLSIDAIGKPLKNYKIYGNSVQNGTPSVDNPVEIKSVGDLVTDGKYTGKYRISVVTSSEQSSKSKTEIYLDEPLRKIKNYADIIDFERGVVERKIKKIVFDGSENFILNSNKAVFVMFIDDIGVFMSNNPPILSSHYQTATIYPDLYTSAVDYGIYFGSSYSDRICIRNKDIATVDGFKEHLAEQYSTGTPVTVYYALTEAITESLALPQLLTIDGTTIISFDTEIKPSNIEITYKGRKPHKN